MTLDLQEETTNPYYCVQHSTEAFSFMTSYCSLYSPSTTLIHYHHLSYCNPSHHGPTQCSSSAALFSTKFTSFPSLTIEFPPLPICQIICCYNITSSHFVAVSWIGAAANSRLSTVLASAQLELLTISQFVVCTVPHSSFGILNFSLKMKKKKKTVLKTVTLISSTLQFWIQGAILGFKQSTGRVLIQYIRI
jgi:hypothetical protein